ncbi:MAG: MCE family protein [Cyclobacteriaceae bacterium]|nr:MCE family protein [Cyclobacteriaceae bacterium SS2]
MSKEFKVGLIALVAGVLLYYGFNFLKGIDFFDPTNKYYAIYDNVDGLHEGNGVIINGYAVGRVTQIDLMENQENILVQFSIKENIQLNDSSIAALTNTDFLGTKGIVITIGTSNVLVEPGDTLISYRDKGLEEILATATPVANNLNVTITRINEILVGLKGSGEKINTTLDDLHRTFLNVNRIMINNESNIEQIATATKSLIRNLNQKIERLGPVIKKTDGVLDTLNSLELAQTLSHIDSVMITLNQTLQLMKSENSSLGKLLYTDSLYQNVNTTMEDLQGLVHHFRNYPKDFVKPLGRKHKNLKGVDEKEE